jgi:GNAT superfamily N-acetyltransferase
MDKTGELGVRLAEIDEATEDTFFRCLHDERPQDPRVTALRHRWYGRHKGKGLRAKVLVRDEDEIVGLCQYLPIEHSHLTGEDLFAILCIWVHGYEHLVGNQQGRGYGRFILQRIEEDARESGAKGIAAWGMDSPHWNPVSFYEHMGYARVETEGLVVLVWKPFADDAKPPALIRPNRMPAKRAGKTTVTVFVNGWCGGSCGQCISARDAVAGLKEIVTYEEVDTSDRTNMLFWGIADAVFLDDTPFRPDGPPWTSNELRAEILEVSKRKNWK